MTAVPEPAVRVPRILIVDDERQNRQLLQIMLEPEGFHLVTAASGEEALAMVAEEAPDLILLDIMMPGMDGYEVAEQIKSNLATKDIPVIMVTALHDRKARMLGLKAGAEEFLSKPVDRAELVVRVRNLSRLKAASDDRHSEMLEGEVDSRTANLVTRAKTLEEQAAILTEQAALLDLAQDAIVVRDMPGEILFWNHGAERMFGWSSAEAVSRNVHELLSTQFPLPLSEIETSLLAQGQWEGELIQRTRNGAQVVVASRSALQRDAAGAPVRVLTINNDITIRKRTDAQLRLLTERLSLATAVARVGVWEWDLDSNTLTWDATMFEIYGIPPMVQMPYQGWAGTVFPDDLPRVEATLYKVIAEKGQGAAEYRITMPDGRVRHVAAVERVVLDERGRVSRVLGVDKDITERVEAERAVEQVRQDQLRFKDDFLSHVSHELRSPLTAIKQFSSILLNGLAGELNKEQREYLEIVLKNIRQLQSMIDDLLEVTRLETGKLTVAPENVLVTSAVMDSINTLQGTADAKGVTLSSRLALDLPAAFADQTRLRQILIILLDNAVKFTPSGGAVTLQVRLQEENPALLEFEVSDTGCGISPERVSRIFERLYQEPDQLQSSRKGLGLGLYICKELVTRQGGEIWVRSKPDQGTTFAFTLPVYSLNLSIAPLLKAGKWPSESVTLLVVEVGTDGDWPSREGKEAWIQEARSLVQRCLLPDLDVLLPTVHAGERGDCFFITAFAAELGAAVLANRIRGQFERLLPHRPSGHTITVSYRVLEPGVPEPGASTEAIVTRMATCVEDAITSHIRSAAVHHE